MQKKQSRRCPPFPSFSRSLVMFWRGLWTISKYIQTLRFNWTTKESSWSSSATMPKTSRKTRLSITY
ncbi:uncharacterized protein CLUP02_17868 [Colletotrichum lupini]|uniref:Uncharacterized protein n=1 Tax=Colletotrichum lupini TaxID=145971 RepID=A0A9Q8WBB9_9PEZI|nr:uncharacterized protein CLUP02_17868 [Colletotrichum lupini]UQC76355.1 hypothetical protein CLUP02_17868 [Colletotrichum lupini]